MNNGNYSVSTTFDFKNPASPVSSGIILVGTAHVSEKSIAVVLDRGRFQAIKGETKEPKEINVKELLSEGKFYYFLIHWLLGFVQKKIGDDAGVKPGAEMLAAIKIAESSGARVALIDRDIQVTLGRFWNKMSFFEKMKLFVSLAGASVGIGTKE